VLKKHEKDTNKYDKPKIIKISLPFWIANVLTKSNLTIIIIPHTYKREIFNVSKNLQNFCLLSTTNLFKNFALNNLRTFLQLSLGIKLNKILEIMNKWKIKKKDFYNFVGKKCIYEKIIFKYIFYPKVTLYKWKNFYLKS
jgi:hypothetical protein